MKAANQNQEVITTVCTVCPCQFSCSVEKLYFSDFLLLFSIFLLSMPSKVIIITVTEFMFLGIILCYGTLSELILTFTKQLRWKWVWVGNKTNLCLRPWPLLFYTETSLCSCAFPTCRRTFNLSKGAVAVLETSRKKKKKIQKNIIPWLSSKLTQSKSIESQFAKNKQMKQTCPQRPRELKMAQVKL